MSGLDDNAEKVGAFSAERWHKLTAGAKPVSAPIPPCRDKAFWEDLSETLAQGENGLDRRSFLQLLGASMALAGVAGCTTSQPDSPIVPYREQPPEVTPGRPAFYATSMLQDGYASGLLVESHEGRPTKVEGNPEHPASLGATSVFAQASVLDLYSPVRQQRLLHQGLELGWQELAIWAHNAGESLSRTHFLLEPTSSPLLASLIARLREQAPGAGFTFYAPLAPYERWRATQSLFGRVLAPQYDLSQADVVLTLDADFLAQGPWHIPWARAFAQRRRLPAAGGMNRLYAIETDLSSTGATADHRLAVPGSLVAALAARVLLDVSATLSGGAASARAAAEAALRSLASHAPGSSFLRAVGSDLVKNRGRCLIIAGERQPALVHAIAYALNDMLGNVGKTVRYTDDALVEARGESHDLERLVRRLDAGDVETLVVLGGNPVYTAPADLGLGEAMAKAQERVVLGYFDTETTRLATWLVPEAHFLESWGDGRAYDGTLSLVQPLVRPLYDGRSAADVLAAFLPGFAGADTRSLLRESWRERLPDEREWEGTLRRGLLAESGFTPSAPSANWAALATLAHSTQLPAARPDGLELALKRDPRVDDGRFARNPWLLELPAPLTTLTWENAALVGVATAAAYGLEDGDIVRLEAGSRALELPVLIEPGHAEDAVSVSLGWGQEGEAPWSSMGANAYRLRTRAAPAFLSVLVKKTGARRLLPRTQVHDLTHHRDIALSVPLAAFARGHNPAAEVQSRPLESFHNRAPDAEHQWGMSIDLSACVGCGACMVACQAENNVPVVGRLGVLKNRHMHWLRIDHYNESSSNQLNVVSQPMLCQQCEKAPCEYVCPVHATVHSPDGLNEMIYNRCVGTRFCSNNCPYKVRRFNWFDYHRYDSETQTMQYNPDVTVRGRGVMEKCTYCVQRIREAEIYARIDGRPLRRDEVQTACQQACPTQAIVFGDIRDPLAGVTRMRHDPRAYSALRDVGTVPRTRYLVKLTNPNPELESA
jgi:Fe-S-cluster-containing dehydrogenase component